MAVCSIMRGACQRVRSILLTKCALRRASMPTMYGGGCPTQSPDLLPEGNLSIHAQPDP